MTIKEAAGFFGVHPQTIRNWIKRGMPATRDIVGLKVIIDISFDQAGKWLEKEADKIRRKQ